MTFKVGDRVRVREGVKTSLFLGSRVGTVKEIIPGNAFPIYVHLDERGGSVGFRETELEHETDAINHPSHYTWLPNGVEVIDLTEHLPFNRGNAVKYLCRAGKKNPATEMEDLKKALWYVQREIRRVEKLNAQN